ncbi:MAG: ABC transporter substrate-binding protein [Methylobacteriaceae bacterium]|nr:ABC transporter substrate-binding protein [Methylobacteriaceae bacterium]
MSGKNGTICSIPRRTVLRGLGGAFLAAGVAAPYVARGQGALRQLKVSVGRIPWAAYNSPMSQYMINNKLFEKHAAALGYDVAVDWREYPTALPMVEAMVGNNLDMGMWGNTPIIRAIVANLPISLMVVGEGHLRFVIATRKDSKIRTMQDLKGKTVGALLGGDPYNALAQMLRHELGSPNPKDHDIKIVNTPTLAQAAQVPTGMDATVAIYPAFLAAEPTGSVAIMNSFGYTESHYEGPLGSGAGHLLPSVKKSAFYPDGYYLHRSFWLVRNKIAEEHPKVVVAFLSAQQEAVATLSKTDAGEVSQLVKQYWQLDAAAGAKAVKDDVLHARGWIWPTENDARAVLEVSKYLVDAKVIDKPLTWGRVKESFALTTPLVKEAFERSGGKPAATEFSRTDVSDLRGLPLWDIAKWADRS